MEMPPEATETLARVSGNFEYWLAGGMVRSTVTSRMWRR
jgi:hypothetical protein